MAGRGRGDGADELSQLHQLYDAKYSSRGRATGARAEIARSAAASHQANDAYMRDFEAALEDMRLAAGGRAAAATDGGDWSAGAAGAAPARSAFARGAGPTAAAAAGAAAAPPAGALRGIRSRSSNATSRRVGPATTASTDARGGAASGATTTATSGIDYEDAAAAAAARPPAPAAAAAVAATSHTVDSVAALFPLLSLPAAAAGSLLSPGTGAGTSSALAGWKRGPRDPAGVLVDLSDRPVMACATRPPLGADGILLPPPSAASAAAASCGVFEVALGCSDHASYVLEVAHAAAAAAAGASGGASASALAPGYDLASAGASAPRASSTGVGSAAAAGRMSAASLSSSTTSRITGIKKRTYYGRRAGHSEWVTGACHLGDGTGRLATCAMDGKICLWAPNTGNARGVSLAGGATGSGGGGGGGAEPVCVDLTGHFGSVSSVQSPGSTPAHMAALRTLQAVQAASGGVASGFRNAYGHLLVSSGYDKTVRLWDCGGALSGRRSTASAGGSRYAATARGDSAGSSSSTALAASSVVGGGACLLVLKGHTAPVLCQAIHPLAGAVPASPAVAAAAYPIDKSPYPFLLATGDRAGVVRLWDMEGATGSATGGACTGVLSGHRGHITAMAWVTPFATATAAAGGFAGGVASVLGAVTHVDLLATGAQDGHVRVWDPRARAPAANIELHTTAEGAGAVGDIAVATVPTAASAAAGGDVTYETLLVTAGADRTVCVLDPRAGFAPRHRFVEHKDFIYSLHMHGPIALSGAGNGMLLAHDIVAGKVLWGLGANEAAVRCIASAGGVLVASGDDGKAIVYDMG